MVYGFLKEARLFCILPVVGLLFAVPSAAAETADDKQPRISAPAPKGGRLTAVQRDARIAEMDVEERIELAFAATDVPPEGVDKITTSSVHVEAASSLYVAPFAPWNGTAEPNPERFRAPDYHLALLRAFPGFVSFSDNRPPIGAGQIRNAGAPRPATTASEAVGVEKPNLAAERAETAPQRAEPQVTHPLLPLPPSPLPSID